MVSAYPRPVRTWSKIGTSLTMISVLVTGVQVGASLYRYRQSEHLEKVVVKGNAFERSLRIRDDKVRFVDNYFYTRQYSEPTSHQFF